MSYMIGDRIKISFTGDVMIEHKRLDSYKVDGGYNFVPLFEPCKSMFENSDYVVANLETPVAGKELQYSIKNYSFNTPESILDALKGSGVSMVTTANNHCLDRGLEGLIATIKELKMHHMDFTGTAMKMNENGPLIKTFGNCKVAFLSYTYGTEACYNMNYLKRSEQFYVNLLKNQELYNPIQRFLIRSNTFGARSLRYIVRRVAPQYLGKPVEDYKQNDSYQKKHLVANIQQCKALGADFIVLCLHVGGQFNEQPTQYARSVVDFCMENGIDLIVGNHEHLIQNIKVFDEKRLAAYCLGNFTSNYAIEREPYDKDAECSIVLHAYLSNVGGKLDVYYTFSIMISILNDNGQIITMPIHDLYNMRTDVTEKNELIALSNKCISRFLGKPYSLHSEPQEEYKISELISE